LPTDDQLLSALRVDKQTKAYAQRQTLLSVTGWQADRPRDRQTDAVG